MTRTKQKVFLKFKLLFGETIIINEFWFSRHTDWVKKYRGEKV
jgi:hypothetical protein